MTIIKLTGNNNFAVKKLLLHDDLTGNYLIYNPFSYAQPQDNWLRDIELFSEEFRADLISMQMSELGHCRNTGNAKNSKALCQISGEQRAYIQTAPDWTRIPNSPTASH